MIYHGTHYLADRAAAAWAFTEDRRRLEELLEARRQRARVWIASRARSDAVDAMRRMAGAFQAATRELAETVNAFGQALRGVKRCADCNGRGRRHWYSVRRCPACRGAGFVGTFHDGGRIAGGQVFHKTGNAGTTEEQLRGHIVERYEERPR